MKFRIFAFSIAATAASVASAHMLVPNSAAVGASSRHETPSQPALQSHAQPPSQPITGPAEIAPAPVPKRSAASTSTRPPVPLLVSRKPTFVPPPGAEDAPAPVDKAAAPVDGTETMARAAIEADGYKAVRSLSRGSDGLWHAKALRGATEVALSVDRDGRVSAD